MSQNLAETQQPAPSSLDDYIQQHQMPAAQQPVVHSDYKLFYYGGPSTSGHGHIPSSDQFQVEVMRDDEEMIIGHNTDQVRHEQQQPAPPSLHDHIQQHQIPAAQQPVGNSDFELYYYGGPSTSGHGHLPSSDQFQLEVPIKAMRDDEEMMIGHDTDQLQQEEPAPSSLDNHPTAQHVDYHTDFEFEDHHHDSPTTSEHDVISHERLPSSDSFKEEEVNKPLDEYSKLRNGESFLMHDTGLDDPDRILFFTTQKNLEHLKASAYWGINCVSKFVPRPFCVTWIIHGFYRFKAIPFVYILVRASNPSTFERAMKLLPEDVRPRHVMMDYNRKEYKLAQAFFPDARFHLCYFYFTSDIMKKIANFHWVSRYRRDEQFHLDVKCFMMLSFVKIPDVHRYFNVLKETFDAIYPDSINLGEFYAYMEEKWIGNPQEGKASEMPAELWNVYDSTLNQYPRTNNFFKTWLARYYGHFRSGYFMDEDQEISVHAFIDNIKMEQNVNEFSITRMNVGAELPQFGKINEDMLKIVKEYDNYQPLDYLRAISAASVAPPRSHKRKRSISRSSKSPARIATPSKSSSAATNSPMGSVRNVFVLH
uniref:MULE transposase domain-containing protein n=1 Tax=Panagrolaimus sp. PS1159 TaxID=55785 RepID=A0AC35G079_9BILA